MKIRIIQWVETKIVKFYNSMGRIQWGISNLLNYHFND
jgi:hypothetical protein